MKTIIIAILIAFILLIGFILFLIILVAKADSKQEEIMSDSINDSDYMTFM